MNHTSRTTVANATVRWDGKYAASTVPVRSYDGGKDLGSAMDLHLSPVPVVRGWKGKYLAVIILPHPMVTLEDGEIGGAAVDLPSLISVVLRWERDLDTAVVRTIQFQCGTTME